MKGSVYRTITSGVAKIITTKNSVCF